MPDGTRPRALTRQLLGLAVRASSAEEREHILNQLREGMNLDDPQLVKALTDEACLLHEQTVRLKAGISELKEIQDEQGAMIKELTGPALHPAVFMGLVETSETILALVSSNNAFRAVNLAPDLEAESFARGDQVLLSDKMNIILHKTPMVIPQGTDVARYHSSLPSGQLVLESHDQKILVHPAQDLPVDQLKENDQITYDSSTKLAFAVVPQPDSSHLFMQEKPVTSWSDIGGLAETKSKLKSAAFLVRDFPELALKYGVGHIRGMILHGPPGNGKTMSLQAFANDLGIDLVMYLRPGELNRMYFGESEKRVRMIFRELRRKADQNPGKFVMLGIEEVDAICGTRGKFGSHVSDKVLGSILAEIDGMTTRGNILIVGTTNRLEDLDPAIARPGRLGDWTIKVSRPNRSDAREILNLQMNDMTSFAETGSDTDETRSLIIEAVLDRIYAPNGLGPVATLKFQDNSHRQVLPRDLMSGALLAKIKADAAEKACLRHIEGGAQGVCLEDFLASIDDELIRMSKTLVPDNCRNYLEDLPQDNRVVAVVPTERKAARIYEILRSA